MQLFSSTSGDDFSLYKPASNELLYGLPTVGELFSFDAERLYEVSVWFETEERLHEARVHLSKLYGLPGFANEDLWLWNWKWPDRQIEIHLCFDHKFNRVTLCLASKAV